MSTCYSIFKSFVGLVTFPLYCYIFSATNRQLRISKYSMCTLPSKFGSVALNLTCFSYLLYDPACGTVKRKAVNKCLTRKSIFNLRYEITTVLVLKQ